MFLIKERRSINNSKGFVTIDTLCAVAPAIPQTTLGGGIYHQGYPQPTVAIRYHAFMCSNAICAGRIKVTSIGEFLGLSEKKVKNKATNSNANHRRRRILCDPRKSGEVGKV